MASLAAAKAFLGPKDDTLGEDRLVPEFLSEGKFMEFSGKLFRIFDKSIVIEQRMEDVDRRLAINKARKERQFMLPERVKEEEEQEEENNSGMIFLGLGAIAAIVTGFIKKVAKFLIATLGFVPLLIRSLIKALGRVLPYMRFLAGPAAVILGIATIIAYQEEIKQYFNELFANVPRKTPDLSTPTEKSSEPGRMIRDIEPDIANNVGVKEAGIDPQAYGRLMSGNEPIEGGMPVEQTTPPNISKDITPKRQPKTSGGVTIQLAPPTTEAPATNNIQMNQNETINQGAPVRQETNVNQNITNNVQPVAQVKQNNTTTNKEITSTGESSNLSVINNNINKIKQETSIINSRESSMDSSVLVIPALRTNLVMVI